METELAAAMITDKTLSFPTEGTKEPWPKDAKIYQPPEENQILLPERASCLAVKAYLRMCKLSFSEKTSVNAEFMSTEGRLTQLPLLRLGKKLLTEFEPITSHVEKMLDEKGLSSWMNEEEREDMRSIVTYTENTCTLAELHKLYLDEDVYVRYTRVRNGAVHPWPLSTWRRHDKREAALRLLRVYQWDKLDRAGVDYELRKCLELLDSMLMEQQESGYIYGQLACELDALIYGHMTAMLSTELPNPWLSSMVREFPRLLSHCRRIDVQYFEGKQLPGEELE